MVRQEILPVKGTRDFEPETQILRKKVFEKIENVFRKYGFVPFETPLVERWNLLKGKYGEEAEKKLIWRFKVPFSKEEYCLRYDLTVPLARFYARFQPPLPFKVYRIERVFRYDEPQKARYREFWQADFDILGSDSFLADAEILNVAIDVFKEFGFSDFEVRINDRRILFGIFRNFGMKNEKIFFEVFRIVDKMDKIGKEKVLKELEKVKLPKKVKEKIKDFLNQTEDFEILEKFENVKEVKEGKESLENIISLVKDKQKIKFDLCLVRGLDYYTSMIFEIVVKEPKIGSLAGGGRYDELIGSLINKKIPAVGGSVGVERLIDAGLELGILKKDQKTYAKVGIIFLKGVKFKDAFEIAEKLRENGVEVWSGLKEYKNVLEGIKDLEKREINYALIIGEKELEIKKFTLQNLKTRERKELTLEEILRIFKE